MKIIFATGNQGKIREVKEILGDQVEVLTMKEAGVDCDPEENGSTFTENAYIKARAVREKCKASGNKELMDCIVMADDSGLEIDAMPGELGVKSARFMGHDTSYDIKNQAILDRMKDVPVEERGARFVCAIAAILPDGRELDTKGVMEGQIGYEISGNGGFGYDPIFYLPEYQASSADISAEEKNRISHRGQALRQMKELL
ncbi:MAG TPA: non-canonical purine NTP pyrophosphatase, RdgB/HAM1 family [Lachnospiraceae bacterium]|mgnify:CR=1 FL=1|jgi:XTP/dITP diphosphohydrolase|nr:RdgB/HAM1 family non-canonical purine NTP pyrophosphatase [Lachnospiraceae bacterium]HAN51210.1 non-canonical purine NTP pyrophosphatase, RdgB/HAM1 family [Lachnospiraceae bacterium]HBE08718.1 non-canonical purine NTP pyrophosphatase, RdgB/HAM1 family [Lachnospiraceae bacterium]